MKTDTGSAEPGYRDPWTWPHLYPEAAKAQGRLATRVDSFHCRHGEYPGTSSCIPRTTEGSAEERLDLHRKNKAACTSQGSE